jgi:hypothetical protein
MADGDHRPAFISFELREREAIWYLEGLRGLPYEETFACHQGGKVAESQLSRRLQVIGFSNLRNGMKAAVAILVGGQLNLLLWLSFHCISRT